MRYIGIIPARYASTRFPGKPLVDIAGKPMIQRVYEQAKKALDHVVVATDDERIYNCVHGFGGEVVMTRADHKCGTDRCLEAYETHGRPTGDPRETHGRPLRDPLETPYRPSGECRETIDPNEDVIINIQGDEPFIQPEQIEAIKSCFEKDGEKIKTDIATLVKPFTTDDTLADLENPNTPKVVFRQDTGEAILFSRSVIPYLRGIDKSEWLAQGKHYRHIGMYAYRAHVLKEITQLPQTNLEKSESLEQLRWLENGYKIRVAVCQTYSMGIDTPEDLTQAIEYLRNKL